MSPFALAYFVVGLKGRGKCLLKNFSTIEEFILFTTEMKRGQIKKIVEGGVQGFIYIKDWFKTMCPPPPF